MAWDADGQLSTVTPSIVDSFAVLSQTILKAPFFLDAVNPNASSAAPPARPRFLYALNDPATSTSVVDAMANYPAVTPTVGEYGAGSLTLGSSITSTNAVSGTFLGYGGPVATFANPYVSSGTNTSAATYINLSSAGIHGPVAGATGWTRSFAFRCTTIPTGADGGLWTWQGQSFQAPYGASVGWVIGGSVGVAPGSLLFRYGTTGILLVSIANAVCDGNWHFVQITVPANGLSGIFGFDGSYSGSLSFPNSINTGNFGSDAIGATPYTGSNIIQNPLNNCQVGALVEYPYALSYTQMGNVYTSWRSCWSGDSSNTRYQRILNWANYNGPVSLQTGATTNMGPATDVIPTNANGGNLTTSGLDALSALNNVVITENGNHFMDTSGTLQFKSRTDRYQPFVAAVTFGEHVSTGEIPYEQIAFDYDTTQVANDCQITNNYSSQTYYAEGITTNPVQPGSQAQYGVRTLQRTVNTNSATEPQDAANFYLYRYGQADVRVSSIRIHVSALYNSLPTAWGTVLGLDIGSRVTVNRRPLGFPAISWNGFIEDIHWDMKGREAFVTFQLSPADRYMFWLFSDAHSTLFSSAMAGSNTVVISPLPDSATNPAKCSFASGQPVIFENGTARAEHFTVNSVSTTSAGYTSATLTLSGNLAFNHAGGSPWSTYETAMSATATANLQSNIAYWDAYAKFGSTTVFAY